MKHIIILLIVTSLLGCSTTAKQKVRDTMADVAHAVEVLNDKYCAETNEEMRNIIQTGIRFYFPAYPDDGYCDLVEILDGK
jgi:hypothetical protein